MKVFTFISMPKALFGTLFAMLLVLHQKEGVAQTVCPNLVTNGDFEAATSTGFTSGLPVNCSCAFNTQCVTTKFNLKCNALPNFGDHTSGLGKFLVVQGSTSLVNIWTTNVTVTPNTPYTFSFWVSGATAFSASESMSPVSLSMVVDGMNLPLSIVTTNNTGWVKYTYNGTTPSGITNLQIAIKQISTGSADYGIDDVSFTSCTFANPVTCGCPRGLVEGATNLIDNGDFSGGNNMFNTEDRKSVV